MKTIKKTFTSAVVGVSTAILFTGCIGLQLGGGEKKSVQNATLGQQLIDLKTAKDVGAISDAEYHSQKSKLLGQ